MYGSPLPGYLLGYPFPERGTRTQWSCTLSYQLGRSGRLGLSVFSHPRKAFSPPHRHVDFVRFSAHAELFTSVVGVDNGTSTVTSAPIEADHVPQMKWKRMTRTFAPSKPWMRRLMCGPLSIFFCGMLTSFTGAQEALHRDGLSHVRGVRLPKRYQ